MSEELKPCPFCGGDGKLYDSGCVRTVICQDCGASTFDAEQSVEAAREEWNRRATDAELAALRARVAELEREVERVREALCKAERALANGKGVEGEDTFISRNGFALNVLNAALAPRAEAWKCPECGSVAAADDGSCLLCGSTCESAPRAEVKP